MDRSMRILLSLAIAILYPVVVYFAVMTVMPRDKSQPYPTYPSCQRETYDYTTRTYTPNYDCQQEVSRYETERQAYEDKRKQDEAKNVQRAQLALGIALLTIVGCIFLRDVKELVGGLTVGAAFTIIVTVSVVAFADGAHQQIHGTNPDISNTLLILLSFGLLSGVIYFAERTITTPSARYHPPIPPPPPSSYTSTPGSSSHREV